VNRHYLEQFLITGLKQNKRNHKKKISADAEFTGVGGGGAGGASPPSKLLIWWKSVKILLKSGKNPWKSGKNPLKSG